MKTRFLAIIENNEIKVLKPISSKQEEEAEFNAQVSARGLDNITDIEENLARWDGGAVQLIWAETPNC